MSNQEGLIVCELCGDKIMSEEKYHEIDQLASDYFMLDTGTIVHKECFDGSCPPSYLNKLDDLERSENDFFPLERLEEFHSF